jgi:hypothetical protein
MSNVCVSAPARPSGVKCVCMGTVHSSGAESVDEMKHINEADSASEAKAGRHLPTHTADTTENNSTAVAVVDMWLQQTAAQVNQDCRGFVG